MKNLKDKQIKEILKLPCIFYDYNQVGIRLFSRRTANYQLFEKSPILVFRQLHEQIYDDIKNAMTEKEQVIKEIEKGTFRYRIEYGRFFDIGKQ